MINVWLNYLMMVRRQYDSLGIHVSVSLRMELLSDLSKDKVAPNAEPAAQGCFQNTKHNAEC